MKQSLHTTNYRDAFIQVADDCAASAAIIPPERAGKPTVAGLQYAMIAGKPYGYTSDDVIFETSAVGRALSASASQKERTAARQQFFCKGQACLRASALGKQFGWGVHADAQGRIAIFAVDSARYRQLANDAKLKQLKAMRSKRA